MNVDSCLRRSSSKERQSSKLYTVMHNFVRIEEQKVVDDKPRSDNDGNVPLDDETTLKCFRFWQKSSIRAYISVV